MHEGKHVCDPKAHTCGEACDLEQSCKSRCTRVGSVLASEAKQSDLYRPETTRSTMKATNARLDLISAARHVISTMEQDTNVVADVCWHCK